MGREFRNQQPAMLISLAWVFTEKKIRHMIRHVACPDLPHFSKLSYKRSDFREKGTE
jgi:hypothetical protein